MIMLTYSDVQGGWLGEGNIDVDPCFVSPGCWVNAGDPNIPTQPDDPNAIWVDGNYHLLPSSACIDAGDPNYVPEPNEMDLDGNPRVIGNRIDMGAYESNYIEFEMKFTPQALNPSSKGKWLKAHLILPQDFSVKDVDANAPAVIVPHGIESDYVDAFINEDDLVEIEAAFSRAVFCTGADFGPAKVTVVGLLTSGQSFYGIDTIRIITNNLQHLATLSSHWLDTDCSAPDWCGDQDINGDSVVNFVDFAMLDD